MVSNGVIDQASSKHTKPTDCLFSAPCKVRNMQTSAYQAYTFQ